MNRLRSWWWGALAFAGIVVTHAVTYQVTEHDHGARRALLHQTGHRFWPWVATVGIAAGVAAVVAFVVRAAHADRPRIPRGRLVLLQGGGWLVLEGVERLAFGQGPHDTLFDTPMLVGLLVQVAIAGVGTLLLMALGRAVDLWRAPRRRPPRAVSSSWPSPPTRRGCWPAFTPAAPRGPPLR